VIGFRLRGKGRADGGVSLVNGFARRAESCPQARKFFSAIGNGYQARKQGAIVSQNVLTVDQRFRG
jgi:hypothetical protein